jgi:hypothetical protein
MKEDKVKGEKLNKREKNEVLLFIYFSDTLVILSKPFIAGSKSRLVMYLV